MNCVKKLIFFIVALVLFFPSTKAEIKIWGSAIFLSINGSDKFYTTKNTLQPLASGTIPFAGILGVFAYNSGNLKIAGAEINTSNSNDYSICGGKLFYTVYKQRERPLNPTFLSFELPFYCNCNGNNFGNCGGGVCNNISDQKFQNVEQAFDLTSLVIGNYTVEIFYQVKGAPINGICNMLLNDNNNNINYTADFSITSPLSISFSGFSSFVTDDDINLKWMVQNDLEVSNYEIEKSLNVLNFSTLSQTQSMRQPGNNSYLFRDASPVTGSNFYRIKAYNDNGSVTISRIIRASYGKVGNTLLIYPSPSGNELTIRFAAINKGNYRLSVINLNGQQIVSIPFYHDGIDKSLRLNLPITLAKGIYRLFLINKTRFYKQTFMSK